LETQVTASLAAEAFSKVTASSSIYYDLMCFTDEPITDANIDGK